jgi:hypothetical protein
MDLFRALCRFYATNRVHAIAKITYRLNDLADSSLYRDPRFLTLLTHLCDPNGRYGGARGRIL